MWVNDVHLNNRLTSFTVQGSREPLNQERIVAVCRELLVEGGPEAVVVREVARRLSVTAPALYKHASGRDDLITMLIATCNDEVARVCAEARDACPTEDHEAQLRAATWAFRGWAMANRPEFALVYGTPVPGYAAPEDGPTVASAMRFGDVFGSIYGGLLRTGRLRVPGREELPPGLADDLEAHALRGGQELPAGALYQFAVGWHRMLGLVSVEVSGHLGWVLGDTEVFVRRQLDDLASDLLLDPAVRS